MNMKVKQILFSAALLSAASVGITVNADQIGPVAEPPNSTVTTGAAVGDTSLPQPTTGGGTVTGTNDTTQPTTGGTGGDTTQPSTDTGGNVNDGTTLPTDSSTVPTEGSGTTQPSTPTTGETPQPSTPTTGETPQPTDTTISPEVSSTTPPTPVVVPNTPNVGTVSPATGQLVENVSQNQPVVTDKGFEIIGTDQGRVIIRSQDVSQNGQELVSAEKIGAKINKDGTISVKTKDGSMKTLPNTGEAKNLMTIIALIFLSIIGLKVTSKSEDNWFMKTV